MIFDLVLSALIIVALFWGPVFQEKCNICRGMGRIEPSDETSIFACKPCKGTGKIGLLPSIMNKNK